VNGPDQIGARALGGSPGLCFLALAQLPESTPGPFWQTAQKLTSQTRGKRPCARGIRSAPCAALLECNISALTDFRNLYTILSFYTLAQLAWSRLLIISPDHSSIAKQLTSRTCGDGLRSTSDQCLGQGTAPETDLPRPW
jgi:hypothetical protein